MEFNGTYALVYIRNMHETIFPVKDMDHAIALAEAIADSDLLNDHVDVNCFDLCKYNKKTNQIGDSWESEDYEDFNEYWRRISNHEDLH